MDNNQEQINNLQAMRNIAKKFNQIGSISDEELFAVNLMLEQGNIEAFLVVLAGVMAANDVYFMVMIKQVMTMREEIGVEILTKIGNGK